MTHSRLLSLALLACVTLALSSLSGSVRAADPPTRPISSTVHAAADPEAALSSLEALLAAAGSSHASQEQAQQAQALLSRLRPPTSARSLGGPAVRSAAPDAVTPSGSDANNATDLGDLLNALPTAEEGTVSSELLDSLATFLAQDAAAEALLAAAASGDDELAELLDSPPYNRSMRCEEAAAANMTASVVDCYCDGVLPWPTCDSRLHQELSRVFSQAALLGGLLSRVGSEMRSHARSPHRAAAAAADGADDGDLMGAADSTPNSRRKLQQYLMCNGMDFNPARLMETAGCIRGSCTAGLVGVGSVSGEVEGCVYAVNIPTGAALSGSDVGRICNTVDCADWTLSDLADISQSAFTVDASIAGQARVCLSVYGLHELLSFFGFDGAFCQSFGGRWWPLKGQLQVHGRATLGWKVAGLWVELGGRMQYLEPSANPMCSLAQLSSWWACQDFCNWGPGDGSLTATAGWDFLWWGDSRAMQILGSPTSFDCSTVVVAEDGDDGSTSSSDDGSTSTSDDGSTSTSDDTTSSSDDATSSSDGCSAFFEVFPGYDLAGGDLADGTVSVASSEDCCQLCDSHELCMAWTFSPHNGACEGPCCFLKDSTWTEAVQASDLTSGVYPS